MLLFNTRSQSTTLQAVYSKADTIASQTEIFLQITDASNWRILASTTQAKTQLKNKRKNSVLLSSFYRNTTKILAERTRNAVGTLATGECFFRLFQAGSRVESAFITIYINTQNHLCYQNFSLIRVRPLQGTV